jgi:hypothetical protein
MEIAYREIFTTISIKSLKNNNYLILEFKINNFIICKSTNGIQLCLNHTKISILINLLKRYSVV